MANISQLHREDLLDKISQIRKFIEKSNRDENSTNLLRYLNEIAKDVKGKKYGLVFEEHREAIDEKLETHIPVLVENKKRFIDNGGEQNFLIEGDNLAALKLLEKTHKGEIDVIYIDPPYNTGNKDFEYDDTFIDEKDTFRHSKWLSFMEKRLRIAKKLLKKNAPILLSIDKNEGFQLKMLLDEIFGEASFVADLHIETSVIAGPRRYAAINGSVVKTAEFVLGYVKGSDSKIMKRPTYDFISGFDTHYSLFWKSTEKKFVKFVDILKENTKIKNFFDKLELKITLPNFVKALSVNDEIKEWLYSKEISENLFRESDGEEELPKEILKKDANEYFLEYNDSFYKVNKDGNAKGLFRYADRLGPCDDFYSNFGERSVRGNLWKGFSADGGNLAKEGGVAFKNGKKPKRLIKQLLNSVTSEKQRKHLTVLDFFAGSGTTAEAVLDLNNDDGGHRSFILCTNNENNICENTTYQRIKNVITGKLANSKTYSEGRLGSLKYFRIDYVPISEKLYYEYADELLLHIRELVELENGINFNNNSEIVIILTDKEMAEFVENNKKKKNPEVKKIYYGHNVLLSNEQTTFFKKYNIKLNVIPDYYYQELEK